MIVSPVRPPSLILLISYFLLVFSSVNILYLDNIFLKYVLMLFSLLQFASFEKAKEVEEFFASRTKPAISRTLKQSIERVHINANWVQSIQKETKLGEAVKELAFRKY